MECENDTVSVGESDWVARNVDVNVDVDVEESVRRIVEVDVKLFVGEGVIVAVNETD
jgi:hypothetical protein